MTSQGPLRYHFHGVDITSDIDLELPGSQQKPTGRHLRIRFASGSPPDLAPPIWQDARLNSEGVPFFSLHYHGDQPVYAIHEVGLFGYDEDGINIYAPSSKRLLPYLLGRLFGLWLELKGTLVLHGSCLDFSGRGRAFLGFSGAGKSTLCAALNQRGRHLVTDDLVPLEPDSDGYRVLPGFPQSRMWPDTGQRFLDDFESFRKVHPDWEKRKIPGSTEHTTFVGESRVLERIYILERIADQNAEPRTEILSPSQALTELIAMSFAARELEALGQAKQRLAMLARVVARVPVVRLTYATGYDHLPRVCDFLQAD